MASIGADNPGTASVSIDPSGEYTVYTGYAGGIAGGGTLDAIWLNLADTGANNDCRVALYSGGTGIIDWDTATLIWDSGQITTVEGSGWTEFTAGGETIPDGIRLYVAWKGESNIFTRRTPLGEEGGLNANVRYGYENSGFNDVTAAFPATITTTNNSSIQGNAICCQIDYSVGGASIIPQASNYYRQQRN